MHKHIFLIDDDLDEAELFRDVISEIDPSITFDFALSGSSAIASLVSKKINPDIIFLDINMPGMDGWECLRQVKAIPGCKDLPVYMYSTSRRNADRQTAHQLGAVELVSKAYDYRKFKETVRGILEGRKKFSLKGPIAGLRSLAGCLFPTRFSRTPGVG